jgi:outer membrane protein W
MGRRKESGSMKSIPVSKLCAACAIVLLVVSPQLRAQESRFYIRIGTGASIPFLANLNDELAIQGTDKLGVGYGFGVSIGHPLFENRWALELHFATMFYPSFDYDNYKTAADSSYYEYFPAKIKHYSYMLVARHNFMSESERFTPTLGAGIGYGQTNLATGGGNLSSLEGLVTGRLDVSIRDNIALAFECSYYAGLQTKEFRSPFLENINTDVVYTSSGEVLKDRYRSLEVRIGLTVWLKPMTQ